VGVALSRFTPLRKNRATSASPVKEVSRQIARDVNRRPYTPRCIVVIIVLQVEADLIVAHFHGKSSGPTLRVEVASAVHATFLRDGASRSAVCPALSGLRGFGDLTFPSHSVCVVQSFKVCCGLEVVEPAVSRHSCKLSSCS
jgi:hypothetical protein